MIIILNVTIYCYCTQLLLEKYGHSTLGCSQRYDVCIWTDVQEIDAFPLLVYEWATTRGSPNMCKIPNERKYSFMKQSPTAIMSKIHIQQMMANGTTNRSILYFYSLVQCYLYSLYYGPYREQHPER